MHASWIPQRGHAVMTAGLRAVLVAMFASVPLDAFAQQTEAERWAEISDCEDLISVEMFLLEFPDSAFANDARNCMDGTPSGDPVTPDPVDDNRIADTLRTCQEHLAANRLTTGQGGTAFECYTSVLSNDPGNREAQDGLRTIADRYATWADAAARQCDKLDKAQSYLDRMEQVNPTDRRIAGIRSTIADKQASCRSGSRVAESEVDDQPANPRPVDETAAQERLMQVLGRGFLPRKSDRNGWTDLHYAAALNLSRLAAALLDNGADPSARLNTGGDPLNDQLQNTLYSLKVGELSSWRLDGQTPLMVAARMNNREVAEQLLLRGASVRERDSDRKTPLHYAASGSALNVIDLLASRGADVNAADKQRKTPLHDGIRSPGVVAALVGRGANYEAGDDKDRRPMHYAVQTPRSMDVLLANGANIEGLDNKRRTPLHYAAMANSANGAEFLIDNGANLRARDYKSRTPLFFAASDNSLDAAKVLLERGADPNKVAFLGQSPVSVAKVKKHRSMMELLERYR